MLIIGALMGASTDEWRGSSVVRGLSRFIEDFSICEPGHRLSGSRRVGMRPMVPGSPPQAPGNHQRLRRSNPAEPFFVVRGAEVNLALCSPT